MGWFTKRIGSFEEQELKLGLAKVEKLAREAERRGDDELRDVARDLKRRGEDVGRRRGWLR